MQQPIPLDERFKAACKAVQMINQQLLKIRNSEAFKSQTKETKCNVINTIEELKNFTQKGSDYPWKDFEKEETIKLAATLAKNIFGLEA